MRRQVVVVALLLCGCDDGDIVDPSPLQPIPHGPSEVAPVPPAPSPRPSAPGPVVVEPPLPTSGAFSISMTISNERAAKRWRGGVRGTAGWSTSARVGKKGQSEFELRVGELGKNAAALFSRLDALAWHRLESGSGTGDGSSTVITITRGEVSHTFTLDGSCDCPAGEAAAAISKALARLPAAKATTATVAPAPASPKKGAHLPEFDCQGAQCVPRGTANARPLICYPTSQPAVQNCVDAPWKSKGVLVKSAPRALEPGKKAWALVLGKGVQCELNGGGAGYACTDGRDLPQVLATGPQSWFALFDEQQAPEPISKVYLLPSSSP